MRKKIYSKPLLILLTEDEINSYSNSRGSCSSCGGKCHRGSC